jgi:hypothetical protein
MPSVRPVVLSRPERLRELANVAQPIGGYFGSFHKCYLILVVLPLHWTQRAQAEAAAGDVGIVDFPPELTFAIPVFQAMHPRSEFVFAPEGFVVSGQHLCQAPDVIDHSPIIRWVVPLGLLWSRHVGAVQG